MREDWFEDPDEAATARPRLRPLLLVAASLPWLLVLGLLILPGRLGDEPAGHAHRDPPSAPPDRGPADDGPTAAGGGEPDASDPDDRDREPGSGVDTRDTAQTPRSRPGVDGATGPDTGATNDPDDPGLVELRGRWRAEPGLEEAVSLAVVVARAWLTGLEPVLDVDIDGVAPVADSYAEHLVVEAVEHPGPDAAVVTLVAIVLGGEDLDANVRRLAVPVLTTPEGPRAAGTPWELPGPDLRGAELPATPIDDPDELLAATEALHRAGLTDVTLTALSASEGWPLVAEVAAGRDGSPSVVWLRRHLDGFVVAGSTVTGPGTSTTPESPTPDPTTPDLTTPDPTTPDPTTPDPTTSDDGAGDDERPSQAEDDGVHTDLQEGT